MDYCFKNDVAQYSIVCDSACDMGGELLRKWGVPYVDLTLKFTDDDKEYKDTDIDPKSFYERMRAGASAKTSAANPGVFTPLFESILKEGRDVLYLGFSSGLSTTVNSARIAAEELSEKYPERKIIVIDTLCASAGFGLLVYLVLKKQAEGATLDEAALYAQSIVPRLCHWFTVDDLEYLKRGGRISPTVAFVGGLLGIKPVLHVDNDGHLVSVTKARGRRASIKMLADKLGESKVDLKSGDIFICQGDCMEDAELLASFIKDGYGLDVDEIVYTGPVIGSHSGPGTLALFFVGKER